MTTAASEASPRKDRPSRRLTVVVTASAIAAAAAASGVQMLFFLDRFGTSHRTDGMLAAYSLFVLVTVAAQGSRVSGSAALGGASPRVLEADFAWAFGLAAFSVAVVSAAGASPIAAAIGPSASDAQEVAKGALPVLGLGAAAQISAIAWATLLGRRGQLVWVGGALTLGAVCGLALFMLLLGPLNEQALPWATVASGGAASLAMAIRAPLRFSRFRPKRFRATIAVLISGNVMPLAPTLMYVGSMAVASRVSSAPGDVTLFGLAFLASSYLCSVVSASGAIVDTVVLSGHDVQPLPALLRGSVPTAVRASTVPVIGGLVIAALLAPPVLRVASLEDVGAVDPQRIATYLLLLIPFSLGVTIMNAAFPSWFTAGEGRRLNRVLPALLGAHVFLSVLVGLAAGLAGVALASAGTGVGLAVATTRPAPELRAAVAGIVAPRLALILGTYAALASLLSIL